MKKIVLCLMFMFLITGCGFMGKSKSGFDDLSTITYGENKIKLFSNVQSTNLELNVSQASNPNNFRDLDTGVFEKANTLSVKNGYTWNSNYLGNNIKITISGVNNTGSDSTINESIIEEIKAEKYNYENTNDKDLKVKILNDLILNESSYNDVKAKLEKYDNVDINDYTTSISITMFDGKDKFTSENKLSANFEFENNTLVNFRVYKSDY